MLALFAPVFFLAAAVIAAIVSPREWALTLLAAGLACWLWQTGAGILP